MNLPSSSEAAAPVVGENVSPVAKRRRRDSDEQQFTVYDAMRLLDDFGCERYDFLLLSDSPIDCDAISAWLPEQSLVISVLVGNNTDVEEEDCTRLEFRKLCCQSSDAVSAAITMLLGTAAAASFARCIAVLSSQRETSNVVEQCISLLVGDDSECDCDVRRFNTAETIEAYVQRFFKDLDLEDEDDEESEIYNDEFFD